MTVQERDMTAGAIKYLFDSKVINTSEFNLLNEYYLKDNRPFELIKEEIIELSNDKNYRDKIIAHLSEIDIEVLEMESTKITDVTDFRKNNKDYLKLNYSDGTTRIVKNNFGKQGREVIEIINQKYNGDTNKIFEGLLKDSIEVNLYDFKDLSNKNIYQNLNAEQQQGLYLILSNENYQGKKIICSPEESIYVVKEENKEDILLQVDNKNGVYQIRQIRENSYEQKELNGEDVEEYKNEGQVRGNQKRLGLGSMSHLKWYDEDAGFMNILFFIFLTGLSSGIIVMIILNLIIK